MKLRKLVSAALAAALSVSCIGSLCIAQAAEPQPSEVSYTWDFTKATDTPVTGHDTSDNNNNNQSVTLVSGGTLETLELGRQDNYGGGKILIDLNKGNKADTLASISTEGLTAYSNGVMIYFSAPAAGKLTLNASTNSNLTYTIDKTGANSGWTDLNGDSAKSETVKFTEAEENQYTSEIDVLAGVLYRIRMNNSNKVVLKQMSFAGSANIVWDFSKIKDGTTYAAPSDAHKNLGLSADGTIDNSLTSTTKPTDGKLTFQLNKGTDATLSKSGGYYAATNNSFCFFYSSTAGTVRLVVDKRVNIQCNPGSWESFDTSGSPKTVYGVVSFDVKAGEYNRIRINNATVNMICFDVDETTEATFVENSEANGNYAAAYMASFGLADGTTYTNPTVTWTVGEDQTYTVIGTQVTSKTYTGNVTGGGSENPVKYGLVIDGTPLDFNSNGLPINAEFTCESITLPE